MLEIGRDKLENTLFLVKDGQNIAKKIINTFDLEGVNNFLLISHSYKYGSFTPNCSTKLYTLYDDIPKILENNLFRIDVIIVCVDKNYTIVLDSIRKITDLPIIFIGYDLEDFSYTKTYITDFKNVYKMYKDINSYSNIPISSLDENKWEEYFLSTSYIKDIKNDCTTTLKYLITEYHRDKKIEKILKRE